MSGMEIDPQPPPTPTTTTTTTATTTATTATTEDAAAAKRKRAPPPVHTGPVRKSSRRPKRKKFDDELLAGSATDVPRSKKRKTRPSSQARLVPVMAPPVALAKAPTVGYAMPHWKPPIATTATAVASKAAKAASSRSSTGGAVSKKQQASERNRLRTARRNAAVDAAVEALRLSGRASSAVKRRRRWTVQDDHVLLGALLSGATCPTDIALGACFSKAFTAAEVTARMQLLIYESAVVSRLIRHCNATPPLSGARVFWSAGEDAVLFRALRSSRVPPTSRCAEILYDNRGVFHPSRTPGHIRARAALIQRTRARIEERRRLCALTGTPDTPDALIAVPARHAEETLARQLAAEYGAEDVRAHQISDVYRCVAIDADRVRAYEQLLHRVRHEAWDVGVLALFRGQSLRATVRHTRVSIGRGPSLADDASGRDSRVDLSLERDCPAVSRMQALIARREDRRWYLLNTGRADVFVNGVLVVRGSCALVPPQACVQIADMAFVWDINLLIADSQPPKQRHAAIAPLHVPRT